MRAYFQLVFSLLIPLSALFIVAVTIYYKNEYALNKAFRIGVLFGSIMGAVVSLFMALFLIIMRLGSNLKSSHPQKSIFQRKKPRTLKDIAQSTVTSQPAQITEEEHTQTPKPVTAPPVKTTIEEKLLLLMDKELAFEVALYAIFDQNIGTLTQNESAGEYLTVKNNDGLLQLAITPLTRHTSQLIVTSTPNSPSAKKVIDYMKEKEYNFLQY